jgi:hypothetical protein
VAAPAVGAACAAVVASGVDVGAPEAGVWLDIGKVRIGLMESVGLGVADSVGFPLAAEPGEDPAAETLVVADPAWHDVAAMPITTAETSVPAGRRIRRENEWDLRRGDTAFLHADMRPSELRWRDGPPPRGHHSRRLPGGAMSDSVPAVPGGCPGSRRASVTPHGG